MDNNNNKKNRTEPLPPLVKRLNNIVQTFVRIQGTALEDA